MKIIFISDTHERHEYLSQYLYDPEFIAGVDMIIHTGDEANNKSPALNLNPALDFLIWYSTLKIKYKIFVPGNHSTALNSGLIKREVYREHGIDLLIHQELSIEGYKIFGSPYTPTFGHNWAYNVKRSKIDNYWKDIPEDTNILATHGPPQGILDSTRSKGPYIESVGDKALLNHVHRVSPQIHCFGHIHDEDGVYNYGMRTRWDTTFINSSIADLRHNPVNEPVIYEI